MSECCHFIGYDTDYGEDGGRLIEIEEAKNSSYTVRPDTPFEYCPLCGTRIDFQAIERERLARLAKKQEESAWAKWAREEFARKEAYYARMRGAEFESW